ncbi:MAG: ATP-grasp domain-containing protein [Bdellovibrionaceae bacterium]|nr:ATP-grasp domain-containing protein [Bdellovibrio sp.]
MLKTLLVFEAGFKSDREYWLLDFKMAGYKLVLVQPWPVDWESTYVDHYMQCKLHPWTNETKIHVVNFARKHSVSGIVCLNEGTVPFANEIANLLNLPSFSKESIIALRNKTIMRQKLSFTSIKQPSFQIIPANDKSVDFCVPYPAVVKPAEFMSSLGVKLVKNDDEASSAILEAREVDFEGENLRAHYGFNADVLLESYVHGDEYSFETFIQHGEIVDFFITKKFKCEEPYFDEIGHLTSPDISDELHLEIYKFIHTLHKELQIENAVTHTEAKILHKEITLIEIACRPGGDFIPKIHEYSANFNFPRAAAEIYTGTKVSQVALPRELRQKIAIFFPYDTKKYKITKDKVLAAVKNSSILEFVFDENKESLINPGLYTLRRGRIIFYASDNTPKVLNELAALAMGL